MQCIKYKYDNVNHSFTNLHFTQIKNMQFHISLHDLNNFTHKLLQFRKLTILKFHCFHNFAFSHRHILA